MLFRLISILRSVSLAFHKVGTILFLNCIVALVTVDVFLRYVFNSPIWGSKEINGLFLILVFFLSLCYCWDAGRHIRVEVFYGLFKGRLQASADIMTGFTGLIFSGLLAFHYIIDLPYVIRTSESGEELGLPFWPIKIFIAVCCSLFFLKMLAHLLFSFKKLYKGQD
jgi:TRAP-type C4-dicarboxylate transport system permease small subunit